MRRTSQLFFVSLSVVTLAGAGCLPFGQRPGATPPDSTTGPSTPSATNAPEASGTHGDLPEIDDTWVTYTSKSLGFTLKTPTKGTLAPTWEVSFVKAGDTNLVDGCYQDQLTTAEPKRLIVDGISFCHTSSIGPAAGNQYWTDHYVANIKNTWIRITFQKHTTAGDNYEDERCHGKYVVNGPSCSGFKDPSEYYAHLDQIMGTFQLGE